MENLLDCCDVRMDDVLIFRVSDNEAGYLIGKKGSRVRDTRKRFNCDIDINDISPRVVYITGKNKVQAYGHMLCSLKNCKN